MSTTVKTGWLNDKNGDKFAPKTLTSQVQTSDGTLFEDKLQTDLDTILATAQAYTDTKTAELASTTEITNSISAHNTSADAHDDIRELITGLTTRLNTLADSNDTTLDQMNEVVTYIKNNRTLIDTLTSDKVNVSDIINNLTTNVSNKPLSAAQGVAIKSLIDSLQTAVDSKANSVHIHAISDVTNLQTTLDAKVPDSRTINGMGLSTNITLSASDVGADASGSADKALISAKEYTDTEVTAIKNIWYGTCTTAAETASKVVTTTTGDFTLKEGATVYVLFNTDNTSTSRITLNVDGTGDTAVNLNSTNGMTAYQIAAKQVICFIYDGESFRVQGGSLATTTYYGLTKLSSSTSSTATNMAATPSAVKEAYDLANAALPQSQLSSAVDSTSETNAATSLAVKNTFALAQSASNLASAALPISGGTMTGALISQNNTDYTTKQVRNIILVAEGDNIPSGSNGDICLVYAP